MSVISEFTKAVAEVNYDALPQDVVTAAKKVVLDTLGVIVAGSGSPHVKKLVELIQDWGGKEESTLLGFGGKVPCPNAALVNGFSAVVWDFDDCNDIAFLNTSRAVIPVSLAIAERKGSVNGRDFIAGVVLGTDIACRMAQAALLHRDGGYMEAPNYFGATAAASKILGLSEKEIGNAFGLCIMQGIGIGTGIPEALNIKGLEGGIAARAGIFAALLAEKGFDGLSDPIEHNKMGFYAMFHRNIYRPGALTVDLGKSFKITATTQKPYPCCRFNHAPVEAALYLITTHDIKPENVAAVSITVGPGSYNNCEPFQAKRKPRNAINTQHSIPWSVASIIVHRKLGIEQNSEEAIRDTRVLAMAQKITTKLIPELKTATTAEPTIVEIQTIDGKTYIKRVDFAFGDPQNPMSFSDVTDKFRYCCRFSEKKISQKSQQAVIDMVEHLEDVPDIAQIVNLLG